MFEVSKPEFSSVNLRISEFQILSFEVLNFESQRFKLGTLKYKTLPEITNPPSWYWTFEASNFEVSNVNESFQIPTLKLIFSNLKFKNWTLKFPLVLQILSLDFKNFKFQGWLKNFKVWHSEIQSLQLWHSNIEVWKLGGSKVLES